MGFDAYVDDKYYTNVFKGSMIPAGELDRVLKAASGTIDVLTFNRIRGRGFENLTQYQKDVIQEVVCRQAEFEYEYESVLNTPLSTYSLNGLSMSIDKSWNVRIENGVAMPKELYLLLGRTGLTCRLVRC